MSLTSPDENLSSHAAGAFAPDAGYRLSAGFRCLLIAGGLGLAGLLVLARCLTPDPSGLGTHRQLGFPPCGFILATGGPCPSCGMTTAWSLMTRGNFVASAEANVGGFLLAVTAIPASVWLLVSGFTGSWFLTRPHSVLLISFAGVIIAATMIQWFLR